jgi:hypothetical protein
MHGADQPRCRLCAHLRSRRTLDAGQAPELPSADALSQRRLDSGSPGVGGSVSAVASSHLMVSDTLSVETSTDGGCTWKSGPTLTSPSPTVPHNGYTTEILQAFWAPTPSEPNTAYVVMGSPGNALFADDPTVTVLRTTDGGGTWSALALGPAAVGYAPSLAVAPSDPRRLYLSVEEGIVLAAPHVIYTSSDGGLTWRQASVLPDNIQRQDVMHLTVDPLVPTTVWAHDYGTSNAATRVLTKLRRSRDAGATWVNLQLPDDYGVNSGFQVIHRPKSPSHLVALPNENTNLKKQRTMYVSDNEGDTWRGIIVPEHVSTLLAGRDQTRLLLGTGSTDAVGYYYVARKRQWFGISGPPKVGGAALAVGLAGVVDSGTTMSVYFSYAKPAGGAAQEHGFAILKLKP